MFPIPRLNFYVIAALIGAMAVAGVFWLGYSYSESKYEAIIAEQKRQIKSLGKQEVKIEKEIVTVFKDRIKVVKEVEQQIVEVARDVIKEESARCPIGPNFIWLHNHSASNTPLPRTTERIDESASKTK